MLLKLTLVENREDRERYSSLVSYEVAEPSTLPPRVQVRIGANPAATGDFLIAVQRIRQYLVDPNGKRRYLVTRVSELRRVPGSRGREWPRKIDQEAPEPEALRRDRVRAMRKAIHVDHAVGAEEPDWERALALAEAAKSRAAAAAPQVSV